MAKKLITSAAKSAPATKPAAPATAPMPTTEQTTTIAMLIGSDAFPSTFDLGDGSTLQLGDVVRAAHEATGATIEDWNALEQPWRDAAMTKALNGFGVPWPPEPVDEPAAEEPAAPADEPAADEAAPIYLGPDVTMTLITSLCGADFALAPGDPHVCSAAEGGRLVAADFARPATSDDAAAIDAYLAAQPAVSQDGEA